MAITSAKTDALEHIQEGQISAAAAQQLSGHFSISILTINYTLDLSVPQITFNITLGGINIGGGTLNTQNPAVTIGGSGPFGSKAEVTLTANFKSNNVTYNITLQPPFGSATTYTGTLFSW